MHVVPYDLIVTRALSKGAKVRRDFPGFREDYLAVHCLIRLHRPVRFMEIGTSVGRGTEVICKAMGLRRRGRGSAGVVYSLDVPPGTDPSIIYPDREDGHPEVAGSACRLPYVQLFGDSAEFDFTPYHPLDAWFIDGKHDHTYAASDTRNALASGPRLIVWHDVQIDGVREAVVELLADRDDYRLARVGDTRVAFASRVSTMPAELDAALRSAHA